MPTFTRRSRASTLQIICTDVGEWTMLNFCLGYFFSSTHFDLMTLMARKVWRHCGPVFVHDRYSHAGNCNGLLANTGLLLSTDNRYLFLLQGLTSPFDSLPRLRINSLVPGVKSFVIKVSDLYFSSPLSSIFDYWASISLDFFSTSYNSNAVLSCTDSRILNLCRLAKI